MATISLKLNQEIIEVAEEYAKRQKRMLSQLDSDGTPLVKSVRRNVKPKTLG